MRYDFTLRFALSSCGMDMDEVADQLYGGGCDDAFVGVGHPGSVALDFARESDSAHNAVMSAIADVHRALPGSTLVEVSPDMVGVSDVAEAVGCSRQNIRQLMVSCSTSVPAPIHDGSQSLWHLAPVLEWLVREKQYRVGEQLMDLAATNMRVNIAMDSLRADADIEDELRAMFA